MRYQEWHDPETNEDCLEVRFTQHDLATVNLDAIERMAFNSPHDLPIADRLQDAYIIAYRLEQAALLPAAQSAEGGARE